MEIVVILSGGSRTQGGLRQDFSKLTLECKMLGVTAPLYFSGIRSSVSLRCVEAGRVQTMVSVSHI